MNKVLGLDLGTNSIGWAFLGTSDNINFQLLKKALGFFKKV